MAQLNPCQATKELVAALRTLPLVERFLWYLCGAGAVILALGLFLLFSVALVVGLFLHSGYEKPDYSIALVAGEYASLGGVGLSIVSATAQFAIRLFDRKNGEPRA